MGTLEEQLEAKVAQAAEEKKLAVQANAVPYPGPTAAAFSPCQDIEVEGLTVRPFYDMDFEVLQMCGHPMAMDSQLFFANLKDAKITDLRGQDAWVVCWLLTTDVDSADELACQGKDAVIKAARKAFGRKQLGELFKVQSACIEQFARYFSTVIGLVEPDKEDAPAPKE